MDRSQSTCDQFMKSTPSQKLPLAPFKIFQTQQLDEVREVMGKVYCDHSLDFSSAGRSLKMDVREVLFPHSAMILASYGESVKVSVGVPESLFAWIPRNI